MATGPYRTTSDLILQVLSDLNIISAGQSIDTEDYATVSNQLDSIIRKLAALEIIYIADPNNIPGAWFMDLAAIVSGEVASSFGFVGPELDQAVNDGLGGAGNIPVGGGKAAQSLKIMMRGRPTYEPARFVNY